MNNSNKTEEQLSKIETRKPRPDILTSLCYLENKRSMDLDIEVEKVNNVIRSFHENLKSIEYPLQDYDEDEDNTILIEVYERLLSDLRRLKNVGLKNLTEKCELTLQDEINIRDFPDYSDRCKKLGYKLSEVS